MRLSSPLVHMIQSAQGGICDEMLAFAGDSLTSRYCRTQTRDVLTPSKAYPQADGNLRGPPIPGSACYLSTPVHLRNKERRYLVPEIRRLPMPGKIPAVSNAAKSNALVS